MYRYVFASNTNIVVMYHLKKKILPDPTAQNYLWHLDKNGRPISYQMWVDILPIGGLKATWSDWKLTETGANLPQSHKLLFIDLGITKIKTY